MGLEIIIFLIAVQMTAMISSQSNDLCILPDKYLNHYESQNAPICQSKKCEGKYSFQCNSNHCLKSKQACNEFLASKLLKNLHVIGEREESMPIMLKENVQKPESDEWDSDDICMNGNDCFSKKIIPMRSRTAIKILKRVDCPCIGYYSYQCGKEFCAADLNACDGFSKRSKRIRPESLSLKGCGNDKFIF